MVGRLFLWKALNAGENPVDRASRVGRLLLAWAIGLLIVWPRSLSSFRYSHSTNDTTLFSLRFAAFCCVVAAWAFQFFVRYRRKALEDRHLMAIKSRPEANVVDIYHIRGGLKMGVGAAALASLAALLAFTIVPVWIDRKSVV